MKVAITTTNDLVYRCHEQNQELVKDKIKRLGFKIKHIKFVEDKEVDYSKQPAPKEKRKSWGVKHDNS